MELFYSLIFGSSSLQEFIITINSLSSHTLGLLQANNNLINVTIQCYNWTKTHSQSIARLMKKNTSLQHLDIIIMTDVLEPYDFCDPRITYRPTSNRYLINKFSSDSHSFMTVCKIEQLQSVM